MDRSWLVWAVGQPGPTLQAGARVLTLVPCELISLTLVAPSLNKGTVALILREVEKHYLDSFQSFHLLPSGGVGPAPAHQGQGFQDRSHRPSRAGGAGGCLGWGRRHTVHLSPAQSPLLLLSLSGLSGQHFQQTGQCMCQGVPHRSPACPAHNLHSTALPLEGFPASLCGTSTLLSAPRRPH